MRTWKTVLYWALAALPMLVVLIVLPGIPQQIPMQYDISGGVSRIGQKYELLVLPGVTLLAVGTLYIIGRRMAKKTSNGAQNQRVLYACGNIISVCFCILTVAMVYYTGHGTTDINQTHAFQIISLVLSMLLLLLGNLLPKCKRTGYIWLAVGFRTPWTLRDDEVWNKTNRIGGYYIVAIGAAGMVISLLVPGMWSLLAVVSLLVLVAIGGCMYSWILYRRLHTESNTNGKL